MPRSLTAIAKAAALAQNTDAAFWVLLELTHVTLPTPLRFVNNNEPVTRLGYVWTPAFFDVELPSEDSERISAAKLSFDNVDRLLIDSILELTSPLAVSLWVCTSADVDMLVGPVEFTWRDTEYTALRIEATLSFDDLLNQKAVKDEFVPSKFPGLFR